MKKLLIVLFVVLSLVLCVACNGDSSNSEENGNNESQDPSKQNISGITFSDASFDYDGTEKSIAISGTLPSGVSVSYENEKATNAGTYKSKATLVGEGYNTLVLEADLVINKIAFTGLTLTGSECDYDGETHSISLNGTLPANTSVAYSGGEDGKNAATNAGVYSVTATVTNPNYITLTLDAELTVNQIPFGTLTFDNGSFDYDTEKHTITVTGFTPSGTVITYTGGEDGKNGATNPGTWTVTATVTNRNYITETLAADIAINSKEEILNAGFFNGNVYFQNSLDGNSLYTYSGSGLEQASRDVASAITVNGSQMFFISKGLLSSSICAINTSGKIESLLDVSATSLTTDGTYIYYSVNSIFKSENNGIYKVSIADLNSESTDAVPVKIASVKADRLNCVGNVIYFVNKSEGDKLYATSTSGSAPTLIYDYKVSELINDGTSLYFTRHKLTGSAIYSINVSGNLKTQVTDDSNKVTKITTSNGKYLTKIGDYIYFINTDMVTSTLLGDGVYRALADGSSWVEDVASLSSSKVIAFDKDTVFSLASDGTNLYYFRTSTRHLYRYNISNGTETDLMDGFVPPEKVEIVTTYYEKATMHNGEIYFINMQDGGRLYKFDPITNTEYRISGLQVADFAIHNGYIYFATVRFMVNFDLYRMSLTYGEPERISTQKCMNFSFYNGKIYYTNYSSSNTLNRMNLDGTEDEIIYSDKSVSAGETFIYDGSVYFVAKDQLYRYNISTSTATLVNKDLKPLEYIIHDGKILMMNCDGLKNSVSLYDISSNTIHKIADLGFSGVSDDARSMFVYDGTLYFYRNVAAGSPNKGLYKVTCTNGTYAVALVDEIDGYYICEGMVDGDKLYFLDVWQVKDSVPTTSSSCKLCVLDLETMEVTELN